MHETAGLTGYRDTAFRVLAFTYGPSLVAVLFAIGIRTEPALEVILASAVDFADGLNPGERWFGFYLRIGIRLACVAAVPAAVYTAARWTLMGTEFEQRPAGQLLPRLFAVIAFVAYLVALYQGLDLPRRCDLPALGWASEIEGASVVLTCERAVTTLLGASAFFAAACLVFIGLFGYLAGTLGGWAPAAPPRVTRAAAGLVAFLILTGILFPAAARPLGPLGVSGTFFALLAFGLAGLTVLSSRHLPGWTYQFPLILAVLLLWVVTDQSAGVLQPAVLVLVVGLVGAFSSGVQRARARHDGPPTSFSAALARAGVALGFGTAALIAAPFAWLWRLVTGRLQPFERAGLFVILVCAGAWALHTITRDCDSLSGCNRLPGVPATTAVLPATPAGAHTAWEGRDETTITVVAAQGGGLFAAYHTAYYLATRADADPSFRRQLFAISGVSGGAVGGGVYWAIRKSGICDRTAAAPDCHRRAVDRILRRDFLSPLLARFYTLDVFDAVIPISALFDTPIDRGAVLEAELNAAVNDWLAEAEDTQPAPRDLLLGALADSWSGAAELPLLFLNTTDVASGDLVVLSPVQSMHRPAAAGTPVRPARLQMANGNDLSVVNAMAASARFLVVTPAVRVLTKMNGEEVRLQLADGGIFDVSGLDAAQDILNDLRAVHPGEIELVVFEVPWLQIDRDALATTLNAPVTSFVGAWRARRDLTKARLAERAAQSRTDPGAPFRICPMRVQVSADVARDFTISWFLARSTFDLIRDQIDGTPAAPVIDYGLVCE